MSRNTGEEDEDVPQGRESQKGKMGKLGRQESGEVVGWGGG